MKLSPLHSAILRQAWLIEPGFAFDHLPVVEALLRGESVELVPGSNVNQYYFDGDIAQFKAAIIAEDNTPLAVYNRWEGYSMAPQGSIAVIEVDGPIMKYGSCGGPGTVAWTQMLAEANKNPNIIGTIAKTDSPGGAVFGTQTFADALAASIKPVVAFISDGMMASAAMWIGSQADYIIASHKTDYIGSIGVMTTFRNLSKAYEKMGVEMRDIYATKSVNKNSDYKKLLEGNDDAVIARLDHINDQFHAAVKRGRGQRLKVKGGTWQTGELFTAEQGIEEGLLDEIGSMATAIAKVKELAGTKKRPRANSTYKANSNSEDTMENPLKKYSKLKALAGKQAENITVEELAAANAQIIGYGITGAEVALAGSADKITQLTQRVADLEASAAEATKKLNTANADVKKYQDLAKEYGAKDAGLKTETTTKDEQPEAGVTQPKASWEEIADRARARNKK